MLIGNEIGALVESAGFDPFIGFVHGLRYGRQSLPLDLVEEFRHPVVDGLVMTMINNGSIKKDDFNKQDNGAYFLEKEAFKRFLGYYEERIEKPFCTGNRTLKQVIANFSRSRLRKSRRPS